MPDTLLMQLVPRLWISQSRFSKTKVRWNAFYLTQVVRNQAGEYFLVKTTDAKPYVKHLSQERARSGLEVEVQVPWSATVSSERVTPNPSVKGSANGMPPGPGGRYAVHFRPPGPGAIPSSPPYLER